MWGREGFVSDPHALGRIRRLEQARRVLREENRPNGVPLYSRVAPRIPDVDASDHCGDHEREHEGQTEQHPVSEPPPFLGQLPALVLLGFGPAAPFFVLPVPLGDRPGEDVVADLEARRRLAGGRVDGAKNPLLLELAEDRLGNGDRHLRIAGEIFGAVDDAQPRGRDQLVEHAGRDRPLLVVEPRHRLVEVPADDPLGAAEAAEGRVPEDVRALLLLLGPEPRHDELEERRLDPRLLRLSVLDDAASRLAEDDLPRPDVLDHRLDELGFDRVLLLARGEQLVVRLDRLHDRSGRRLLVQVLEAEVAGEQVRDPPLEAVEHRVRVLAERDQEVRPQVLAVDGPRELDRERARAVFVGVVDEVLLELVEDDEQLGADGVSELGRAGHVQCALVEPADPLVQQLVEGEVARRRLGRLFAEDLADRRGQAVGETCDRVVAPAGEDDHERQRVATGRERLLPLHAEVPLDARPDDGALADATCPVEEGQAGCEQVGGDQPALLLAPEEELRVALGEGRQPDVGRLRDRPTRLKRSLDDLSHVPAPTAGAGKAPSSPEM